MINWIGRILTGWYNKLTGKNQEIANKRLQICMACEYKRHLLGDEYICSLCGCVLSAKTRVNEEKCELNKW